MPFAQAERREDIGVIWLDHPDEKVNKISLQFVDEFSQLLDTLLNDGAIKAIILISRKPDNFIAGADIQAFLDFSEPGQAESASRMGQSVLDQLAGTDKPTIAAIHGPALGGGLEIALACSYRIATEDAATFLGAPEVKLGLLPGAGGTQRLPRLIGIQPALQMMLTGKNIYARRARRMGLVDECVHPYGLLEAAMSAARELMTKPYVRKSRQPWYMRLLERTRYGRNLIFGQALKMAERSTRGNYPAPGHIIDCVRMGFDENMAVGLVEESRRFDELMRSPQARQLIHLFFAMNEAKKNPRQKQASPIDCIGILGAGLMGAGIAGVSADNGMNVILKDLNWQAVAAGEKAIWSDLQRRVRKRILRPFERDLILSRISGTIDFGQFGRAKLVIEAVFEDLALKQSILAEIEETTGNDTIFASNTSSLPIALIAEKSKRPELVVGMHYFSPVARMPLLEIIYTKRTEDWVVATATEIGVKQGKHVIVVQDGPGFYTTRILAPMMNEAALLLESGADIGLIDESMRQFGFPVGPMALMDEVGLDVCAHVTQVMSDHFAKRDIEPSDLAAKMQAQDLKGRKSGLGFYVYPRSSKNWLGRRRRKEINRGIYGLAGTKTRQAFEAEEIRDRLSGMMINEAALCLQAGIIATPADGDLGAVLGLGFPPFLGGPFRYVDALGTDAYMKKMEALAAKYGPRFSPPRIIQDLNKKKGSFY